MSESFEDAFNAAETRAPRLTEVPAGKTMYVVKGYNIKDVEREGQQQQEVGIRLYFPKYGLTEWANYGHKAAGILKSALTSIGANVSSGLKGALESSVGRFGDIEKSFSDKTNKEGKPYARYTFLSGEAPKEESDSIPF